MWKCDHFKLNQIWQSSIAKCQVTKYSKGHVRSFFIWSVSVDYVMWTHVHLEDSTSLNLSLTNESNGWTKISANIALLQILYIGIVVYVGR